ncbi:MAG: hypothetical protein SFT68_02905 [Rickettsiaceae bacterium]|nr:hypothetical protein [Rickettsiaceae bacterium]
MRLKYILLLIFINFGIASNTFAWGWGDFIRCLENPCDCLGTRIRKSWAPDSYTIAQLTDSTYNYDAAGSSYQAFPSDWSYSYDKPEDLLCPPYNKKGGLKGCLVQFLPPINPLRVIVNSALSIDSIAQQYENALNAAASLSAPNYADIPYSSSPILPFEAYGSLAGAYTNLDNFIQVVSNPEALALTALYVSESWFPYIFRTSYPHPANYSVYCAEADKNRNFQNPTIRVRMQNCNLFACWTQTKLLHAKVGECVNFASPWGLPTTRFCARFAIPRLEDPNNTGSISNIELNPDYGYQFHFLDTHGFPRPDPGIAVSSDIITAATTADSTLDTSNLKIFLPKVCLYEDPSFYQTLYAFLNPWYRNPLEYDTYDLNPNYMLYHPGQQTTTPSFLNTLNASVTKNLVVEDSFFFQTRGSSATGNADSFFFPFDPSDVTTFTGTASDGVNIMGKYVDMRWNNSADDYTNWVKDFVYNKSESLGCVYAHIGPFPPPFCQQTPALPGSATLQKICPQEASLINNNWTLSTTASTFTNPCVKSPVRNNFIYNSVRVSSDKIIQLCTSGASPSSTCASIYPTSTTTYAINQNNDTLPICSGPSSAPTNAPCVLTTYSSNNCKGSSCSSGMRIVYGYQSDASSGVLPVYGYPSNAYGECDGYTYPCRQIYGINVGAYEDISIDLSSKVNDTTGYSQISSLILNTVSSGSISSSTPDTLTIQTYISYLGSDNEIELDDISISGGLTDSLTLNGNSICAIFASALANLSSSMGCVERAAAPPITAATCTSSNCPGQNTYAAPAIYVTLGYSNLTADGTTITSLPTDSVGQALGLVYNSSTDPLDSPYTNLIGAQIATIATDTTYVVPPYYGASAYSQGGNVIFGNYVDATNVALTSPFINTNGTISTNQAARYTGGIEYTNSGYYRGGVYIGAALAPYAKCQTSSSNDSTATSDSSNCVLTTRNYYNLVNCDTFDSYSIPARCPSSFSGVTCSTQTASLSLTDGSGDSILFYSCSDGSTCYSAPTNMPLDVCGASTNPANRVYPTYTTGSSPVTTSYFDVTNLQVAADDICKPISTSTSSSTSTSTTSLYNTAKCTVRDKTIFEMGGIGTIPAPQQCSNDSAGGATWTIVSLGEYSLGTCPSGTSATLPSRLCYIPESATSAQDAITPRLESINVTCQ